MWEGEVGLCVTGGTGGSRRSGTGKVLGKCTIIGALYAHTHARTHTHTRTHTHKSGQDLSESSKWKSVQQMGSKPSDLNSRGMSVSV